ncbi:DNA-binding transcriptional LysR family regulator [Variovorax boronicumulans]|uniref:DNA-binding transcriptional LysR family regulator n=1 Tax=Variovorax boronicumulans TaxID=436515 RepID=A0AAW8CX34_9BURK|nr:LysR substrate-binding domain-containing protein [Variovorax boronicumulans]MDP9894802.1 DNA-binding transcriptional LysR family regulator [Variovorax boronicumulans]MDQ0054621.1 DNA-binding transcriptional LysR family regulator [Variovorax boronicumulans]
MSQRLQGIEEFVAAVEAGSFALAAQRLHVTRSAVAKSIARLEARLNTRLFLRTTRSQSLTEEGHGYYERCRRVLAELDAAEAVTDTARSTAAGLVRISMPAMLGRLKVGPLLLALARRHPALSLELAFSDRRVDLVEEGLDLAIRSGELADTSELVARPVGVQWMVLCAAPAYLAERGHPRGIEALTASQTPHEAVVYARDGQVSTWHFHGADGRLVDVTLPSRLRCDSAEVLLEAAIGGMGLARLPAWLAADALAAGTLVRVFEEPKPFGFELNVIRSRSRYLPFKTRVVIDWLAEHLPPLLVVP